MNKFLQAQFTLAGIVLVAYLGNQWPHSYPRNDNHKPYMLWCWMAVLFVLSVYTLQHRSSSNLQLLNRPQTEEWKGWMQSMFILYHYYRVYSVYNWIRVFVSSYVWMTGFGNFLYFDKKHDYSIERMVSMWVRINYFPLLLSFCLGVPLELYYVVPLHTTGFFLTLATCAFSKLVCMDRLGWSSVRSNAVALAACGVVHVLFYETAASNLLKLFSDEYYFRFQSDKYTAWVGMLSGFGWSRLTTLVHWAHQQAWRMWTQRAGGLLLIGLWFGLFGSITDKYIYNPFHPYVFWLPVAGYLLLRNSSPYLCELHAHALEWLGQITLETYVLQFHVFMSHNVQHIPIVVPGSGPDGSLFLQTCNMVLCGILFVTMSYYARQATVTTQTCVIESIRHYRYGSPNNTSTNNELDMQPLSRSDGNGGVQEVKHQV